MKLNNKLKLSLIAITTIAGTNTNAQTFYQCMPLVCKAGQFIDGNSCKDCPAGSRCDGKSKYACGAGTVSNAGASSCTTCAAGTYQQGNSCVKCPAGTYSQVTGASSSAVCTNCPDYQWSNPGAVKCNWIKVKLNMSDYDDASGGSLKGQTSAWFNVSLFTGEGLLCNVSNFPTDPTSYWGGCGTGNIWISSEKNKDRLKGDCRRLPCWITNKGISNERRFILNTNGSTTEYWSAKDPNPNGYISTNYGTVKWD